MDGIPKPSCYDDVPACLCTKCQLYDVVSAESSSVSSSFLPVRYAATVYSSPADSCEVSSVLSTRPSCSVAESTCGLASTVPPRRPCRPRRRRFEFAVSSPPFMLPVSSAVSSSSASVSSGSVLPNPASPVQTCGAASSAVSSSSVSVPSGSVLPNPASPVQASAFVGSAVSSSSVSVPSGPVLPSPASPVVVSTAASSSAPLFTPVSSVSSRAWSRPVPPSRPFRSAVPPFRPVAPLFRPLLVPRLPLFPVVCLVLVAVLLPSPFGLVLSFLPLFR